MVKRELLSPSSLRGWGARLPFGSLCFFLCEEPTFYIDGFNLYYGCLKGSPFKWLDPSKLCPHLLPKGHQVHEIKYYTARVSWPGRSSC
jgi:hypothetical protein